MFLLKPFDMVASEASDERWWCTREEFYC